MNDGISGKDPERAKAEHGAPSEMNWDGGQGRQPYENREADRHSGPAAGHEAAEGDRGATSGRNLEQLEQVKRRP